MMTPEPVPPCTKPCGALPAGSGWWWRSAVTLMVTTAGDTSLTTSMMTWLSPAASLTPAAAAGWVVSAANTAPDATAAPMPADTRHRAPMPMACAMPMVRRACVATTAVVPAPVAAGRDGTPA